MTKNKHFRSVFAALLCAVLCMTAFATVAYADGGDYYDDELPPETWQEETQPEDNTIAPGTPFTEDGIAATRELLYDKHTNKQFITVETRNGHTLYLVIDYDKPLDEDGEQYETYFLNLVDESDLLALLDEEDTAPVCTCKDKCEAGAVNTSCEVCKNNMTECMGKEAEPVTEPEVTPEPEPEPAKKSGSGLVAIVLLLALAGSGALYWFKLRKPKADTKGPADLDDYDFGEADDDTKYETEEDESGAPVDSVDD